MRSWIRSACLAAGFVLAAGAAAQAAIHWTMDILPTSSTTVSPGGSVNYELVGVISGDANLGLALAGVDVHASYAIPNGLPPVLPGPEMYNFVRPWGLTNPPGPADDNPLNPSGYGGTPDGDDWLRQIGGGQNTIGNTPGGAPYPIGHTIEGIGLTPVQIAFGVANLPTTPGTYTLSLSTPFANALTEFRGYNADGYPMYAVSEMITGFGQQSFSVTVLPEPASGLLLIGCAALATRLRRR